MRKLLTLFFLLNVVVTYAQVKPSGILLNLKNANTKAVKGISEVRALDSSHPVELSFQTHTCVGVNREDNKWYVLPLNDVSGKISANTNLWILPQDALSKDNAYLIKLSGSDSVTVVSENDRLRVNVYSPKFELHTAEARPHSDCFNNRYALNIQGGDAFANTLAGFYWGTMLQSVIEKTKAKNYPYSSGYVISTLNPKAYAGSYPDVDHEFQIKGRLAFASDLDIDVVKRMMELQFKLMQDDPEGLFRDPCSVQPSGEREYHIRRNSQNNKVNANMFLLTGNMEIQEEAFHYFEATKDSAWLNKNIDNLEKAAALTIANTDQYGRVWSDVYYEDQVMKDGRETMSGALAAYTFKLLAQMENILNRGDKSGYYSELSKKIAQQLVKPLPQGFWDEQEQRFVDWVDRSGVKHNHIHLLANILPVIFGYTTEAQTRAVAKLVNSNLAEFQRFPSFISADVAAYDKNEIGDGGPYDLCAAGRYWWWDASYWKWLNNTDMLYKQLKTVAAEAVKDSYYMGERYDMNHVYYVDNKDWHGADMYYEYPCVYTSVLIDNYLGIQHSLNADLSINPKVNGYGTVEFTNPLYNIRYTVTAKGFKLKNLSNKPRRFAVDLSSVFKGKRLKFVGKSKAESPDAVISLAANEEASWVISK
ncbi:hypothetical protein SAMN05192574_102100 [Mucilaginibacter gossypiicola]|uniref:Alpha-L-rhamnosidase six-hairpin glycosidase domain-containing protein n=1 Tax=Mucilaginibacter gossypiicola TaxID=551995 RepID=A0A1H8CW09_9SPHI|nr:hypothetical protein [Mucilaginibacter gossypiicola]SEM99186.1 hypothetical protein SAMN05192574_102100 [Mucilaginibacter gossypiicola]